MKIVEYINKEPMNKDESFKYSELSLELTEKLIKKRKP